MKMSLVFVKEKIIENECVHHIIDNIYLGNCNSRKFIPDFKINRLIQIGEKDEIINYYPINNLESLTVNIPDNKNVDLSLYYQCVWDFIKKDEENVLIHCKMGTSRSVAFVVSYLIKYKNFDLNQALDFIKEIRADNIYTKPNIGFIKQLRKLKLKQDCK
jgi:predicted protein tyrosine phosphatase